MGDSVTDRGFRRRAWFVGVAACLAASPPARARPPADRPLLLAHYMPWYAAKPAAPAWGWHWTMNAVDPGWETGGRRAIASHYYPLIGPYDSGDPVVLEYHLLLMKLAGIDGVIIDWYGTVDHLDYAFLHRNTGALVAASGTLGLKVAVCYEDQTVPKLVAAGKLAPGDRVKYVRGEIGWLRTNWFSRPNYLRLGGKPLLLSFGADGLTDGERGDALRGADDALVYVSEHRRRPAAAGAFDWPIPKEYPAAQDRFYAGAAGLNPAVPVAFPRFHDYYADAKVQASHGRIGDEGGRTWAATLERAVKSHAPVVQLATWNDWGEGTGIEPTAEFGYRDLEVVQRSRRALIDPGFPFCAEDLRLAHRLLLLRRQPDAGSRRSELDQVAGSLAKGAVAEARAAAERLERSGRK